MSKLMDKVFAGFKAQIVGFVTQQLIWHESCSDYMSLVMRKPAFCICENKDADQLRSNCVADQRLCFRYMDSTIPLLSKAKISSLKPSSVGLQTDLCQTWSETPKTGFLITRLIIIEMYVIISNPCTWKLDHGCSP